MKANKFFMEELNKKLGGRQSNNAPINADNNHKIIQDIKNPSPEK